MSAGATHSEPDAGQQELVAAALTLMAERGLLGFAWLDENLSVTGTYGAVSSFIPKGLTLAASVPALVGMEDRIKALRRAPHRPVTVPNIAIKTTEADAPKVNLQVYWLGSHRCYLLAVTREITQSDLELELRREMRARRLAEGLVLEKTKEIERANSELKRANRDLEEFAYVIAHDLKAPLRALRVTAELLERDLGGTTAPVVQQGLGKIRQQVRRMSQMMTGLLEYARIGRKQEALAPVDTGKLIKDILETIGQPEGLRIEALTPWPTFATLREPLDIVLRNLIENAIKHHDTKLGAISLRATPTDKTYIFEIADDGPGIPSEYHAAVFEPFRRVHDDGLTEGSGIGLALVKKTLELVGGSIELESEPAQRRGALFRVHWPRTITL